MSSQDAENQGHATPGRPATTIEKYQPKGRNIMSHIIIEGNVTAEPEGGYGQASGKPYAKVKVAVNNRVRQQDGSYSDGPTSYYRATVFGALAEHVLNDLHTGTPVVVAGDVTVEGFTRDDGTPGVSNEIMASHLAVSLRFGGVTFTRTARTNAE